MASHEEIKRMTSKELDAEIARLKIEGDVLDRILKEQWRTLKYPAILVAIVLIAVILENTYF